MEDAMSWGVFVLPGSHFIMYYAFDLRDCGLELIEAHGYQFVCYASSKDEAEELKQKYQNSIDL